MLRRLDLFQYTDLAVILSKDERIDYMKKKLYLDINMALSNFDDALKTYMRIHLVPCRIVSRLLRL
jgi:hypothetical protein